MVTAKRWTVFIWRKFVKCRVFAPIFDSSFTFLFLCMRSRECVCTFVSLYFFHWFDCCSTHCWQHHGGNCLYFVIFLIDDSFNMTRMFVICWCCWLFYLCRGLQFVCSSWDQNHQSRTHFCGQRRRMYASIWRHDVPSHTTLFFTLANGKNSLLFFYICW